MGSTAEQRMSYADLLELPEDGLRHELIDGIHYVSPSPRTRHQAAVGRLFQAMLSWADEHGGRCYVAPTDVLFSDDTVLEPDVLLLGPDRVGQVHELRIDAPPDIVVEVSSPSTASHDLIRKRRVYERYAVPEFWFVDLDEETIAQYVLTDGRYDDIRTVARGEHVTSVALPALRVDIDMVMDAR